MLTILFSFSWAVPVFRRSDSSFFEQPCKLLAPDLA